MIIDQDHKFCIGQRTHKKRKQNNEGKGKEKDTRCEFGNGTIVLQNFQLTIFKAKGIRVAKPISQTLTKQRCCWCLDFALLHRERWVKKVGVWDLVFFL
ncbi:hypothetical protein VNO77_33594 [Canavalia gladiata]|uniref:Uncharacterized protein n=1 Tax=Canavalia gladiata TaxID=3824 RepID=A0AAN9PYH1_CANGL